MASLHHCIQPSFEGIPSSQLELPLDMKLRNHARDRFYSICNHFDTGIPRSEIPPDDYGRPRLIRSTYDNALSQESRDHFLRAFFRAVDLAMDGEESVSLENIRLKFFEFGEHLFNNFFLPSRVPLPNIYHRPPFANNS